MLDSQAFEKGVSILMDKGAFFGTVFLCALGVLIKMDALFGYPLDGPHKFVLFLLLLFVCVYGHYSMKAIKFGPI